MTMKELARRNGVMVEAVARGAAFASLDTAIDPAVQTSAIFTLAEHSSRAALHGAVAPLDIALSAPVESRLSLERQPNGAVAAAAAVELEIVDDFVDALGRDGRITAAVNVVVIDEAGEPVASASFDWVVLHRA
jgi:hypothetical protein